MNHINKQRQECTIFSRCCGWLVPKHASNPGKQEEYKDRTMFKYDKKQ
jgi:anaerobic ribonucleoside-triphosphate reductase